MISADFDYVLWIFDADHGGNTETKEPRNFASAFALFIEVDDSFADRGMARMATPCHTAPSVQSYMFYGIDLNTAPSSVVKPPCIAESPASLECSEWGTLQIGGNRLIIGLVKRLQPRDELFDPQTQRIRSERFHVIGRMASPHWYCRTTDRFEMKRPD